MTNRDTIGIQLRACRNENGWFTSMAAAVKGLTQKQADWKSNEEMNSVHEIVRHLDFYNHRYLKRFQGEEVPEFAGDNDDTFDPEPNVEGTWQEALAAYDATLSEWIDGIEQADDDKFGKWASDLSHLTIHNAYHIGQIVFIRKQQGSWDKKYGVS
ncbi:DinB family protein [Saccharibacillus brassicae]|uniref:DinB family protein n=1 Tax=Saccharibacillus brassicae TaxID=2583377 RepID=A0A4Y6V4B6_SACBS|nr:DinB family protein [Saccharibacillus brassicae]QDH23125.1 DinB family protein [Saccharibacillus brassicae]